jgi:predicted transcriptional regulator
MMKAISLRLAPEQYQRLRVLSFTSDKPVSEMIREAIDGYLQEHQTPKPGQEWFWAEAWQKAEREAEADLASGNYETFDNDVDFLASLK